MLKKKKQIKKIIVTLNSVGDKETQIREFDIPENGSYKIRDITGNFCIYDSNKDIITEIRWQAGFTQDYEFIY